MDFYIATDANGDEICSVLIDFKESLETFRDQFHVVKLYREDTQ
jgi:hypothetical protein